MHITSSVILLILIIVQFTKPIHTKTLFTFLGFFQMELFCLKIFCFKAGFNDSILLSIEITVLVLSLLFLSFNTKANIFARIFSVGILVLMVVNSHFLSAQYLLYHFFTQLIFFNIQLLVDVCHLTEVGTCFLISIEIYLSAFVQIDNFDGFGLSWEERLLVAGVIGIAVWFSMVVIGIRLERLRVRKKGVRKASNQDSNQMKKEHSFRSSKSLL